MLDSKVLSEDQLLEFYQNGFLVLPDFLNENVIQKLKNSCHRIVDEIKPEDHTRTVFSTTEHAQSIYSDYFLDSADKVHFFFEKEALDDEGEPKVDKHFALNKIGHAMHWHIPEFREVSFSMPVKAISRQLGFKSPALVQSMYIFKQPGFGGEVTPHKDSTFLSTDPESCVGFWFALEDASEGNGCLWFIPDSHKTPTKRRFIRNPDPNGPSTIFTLPPDPDNPSDYVPVPVKRGSLVLIDGQVDHKSSKNESMKSRHIYTFHLIERQNVKWNPLNWIQPTPQLPFTGLYEN